MTIQFRRILSITANKDVQPWGAPRLIPMLRSAVTGVAEEHRSLFPKVRRSDLDLKDLGRRLAELKEKLTAAPKAKRTTPRRPRPSPGRTPEVI